MVLRNLSIDERDLKTRDRSHHAWQKPGGGRTRRTPYARPFPICSNHPVVLPDSFSKCLGIEPGPEFRRKSPQSHAYFTSACSGRLQPECSLSTWTNCAFEHLAPAVFTQKKGTSLHFLYYSRRVASLTC